MNRPRECNPAFVVLKASYDDFGGFVGLHQKRHMKIIGVCHPRYDKAGTDDINFNTAVFHGTAKRLSIEPDRAF